MLLALLTPFLLQLTFDSGSWAVYLAGAALLASGYGALRREAREDGMTPSQRLTKLEATLAKHEARQTGFQGLIEKVADDCKVVQEATRENHRRDMEAIRESVKDVPLMREMLARYDENMKATRGDVGEVKGKIDRLFELLTQR